ncbi:nucleotidyltransferase domain-containing protein [Bacillus niameyensis]|uniref:nucleotidyltransferase domain-containing protein n=1 Tax=Bacillus niameyensis TaxID=1522308 RepID=UPI00078352DB|nr:nucleotidyltransferase domain-containing protein [Bacillus niameyensis]
MDNRYKPITGYVVQQFSKHLGSRLNSIYIKGSVARGDAVWGISDLDLVLAFESHTKEDNLVKKHVEETVRNIKGGEALVIQRIANQRLMEMDENTKIYWLYSSYYDSEVLYGKHPSTFLPKLPEKEKCAMAILSILKDDGKDINSLKNLDTNGSRLVAKYILQSIAMSFVYEGHADYIPLTKVQKYPLPTSLQDYIPYVVDVFLNPREIADAQKLVEAWNATWKVITEQIGNISLHNG